VFEKYIGQPNTRLPSLRFTIKYLFGSVKTSSQTVSRAVLLITFKRIREDMNPGIKNAKIVRASVVIFISSSLKVDVS